MKKLFKGIGIFIVAVFLLGVVGRIATGGTTEDGKKGDDVVEKTPDFTIEGDVTAGYDEIKFGYYIEGIVKNNTDKDKGYVQISFNLYDADGNQLGTALDNINNLKAGGTWKFKAMGMGDGIESYEFAEIVGF